jgi:hypothetical protein
MDLFPLMTIVFAYGLSQFLKQSQGILAQNVVLTT